jgi:predicted nuclease of restriction endonuclease-like (RecB) superfamily
MNYYNEIKKELINNEINRRVKNYSINKGDLSTYYNVGKMLSEAGRHYGEGIIKEYSRRLTSEIGKGYSKRNLWLMLRFYEFNEKMQTVSAQLSWSHYVELLPYKDLNKIKYYIRIIEDQNLSIRQLRQKLKLQEYERLDVETCNKLINQETTTIADFIKNPIVIKNSNNYEEISEKILKKLILEDMDNFLKELGEGFCYIGNEYKIKIGDRYNYID